MSYIKSGFIDLDDDEIFEFQNYCMKWGIKGKKWLDDWNFKDETLENKQNIQRMKDIRKMVIEPLEALKKKLSKEKTYSNITKSLFEFLIENNINKILKDKIDNLNEIGELEIAMEYETSWDIVISVLDEIELVFKDDKVSLDKYFRVLKIGLSNSSLGKIPMAQDQVILGDVDRSRSHKVRAIFIIGLNDGIFPKVNNDEGFLGDADREYLKQNGLELAKGTLDQMYEDNFNIYKAFTTAEEKLFLSYASSDSEGKSLRQSILITKIKRIFPEIKQSSDVITKNSEILTKDTAFDDLIVKMQEYLQGKEIEEKWFDVYAYYNSKEEYSDKLKSAIEAIKASNNVSQINKENIDKLYGNTLKTSVSRLEQYKSCPFSYFLKYGLKLNPKDNFKIKAIDTGTFMHEVIDEFFERARENEISIKSIEDDQVDKIIDEIVMEKLGLSKNYIFTSIPKYINLTNRLKKVIKLSINYILQSLRNSSFEILGNEIEFGNGKQYKPIRLELDNGKSVEIIGKIDRIDIAKNAEGKYIRIIDYKSSVKNIDLNEVVAGLQLQLLTYLDATCNIENMLPAGVLYFNLIEPYIKTGKNISDEAVMEELKKKFKMQGLILADVNVVKMMDNTLEKGASKIIPAYIDKDGEISKGRSNAITKVQFEYLQKYINKLIKQISTEILNGNINIKPYYNLKTKRTPCDYCDYKAICNFNNSDCKKNYNYIGNLEKEAILEMIKEEKDE